MATNALRSLWAEPRPTDARGRQPWDWALVVVLVVWSLMEVVLRQDLAPLPLLLLAVLAVLGPLPWRRTHPFLAVAIAFGTLTIVDVVRILTESPGALLNSISATLVLAYALFRWGSGREAASGLGVIAAWLTVTNIADTTSSAESAAAYGFFLFAAALGAAIRYRAKIRVRDIDQAQARERDQLARELHDTVAHHVSGIAIQAQAGRAIAASRPEGAVEAGLHRLAQESVTNARRHARHATRVTVAVAGEVDQVRLTVVDDGSAAGGRAPVGYGLVGMHERASLLGGTFDAGPTAERGWRVEAVLRRTGQPRIGQSRIGQSRAGTRR